MLRNVEREGLWADGTGPLRLYLRSHPMAVAVAQLPSQAPAAVLAPGRYAGWETQP